MTGWILLLTLCAVTCFAADEDLFPDTTRWQSPDQPVWAKRGGRGTRSQEQGVTKVMKNEC